LERQGRRNVLTDGSVHAAPTEEHEHETPDTTLIFRSEAIVMNEEIWLPPEKNRPAKPDGQMVLEQYIRPKKSL
jgi:hypothetical protein